MPCSQPQPDLHTNQDLEEQRERRHNPEAGRARVPSHTDEHENHGQLGHSSDRHVSADKHLNTRSTRPRNYGKASMIDVPLISAPAP